MVVLSLNLWHGCVMLGHLTCDQEVVGSTAAVPLSCNNSGQLVHTCVPMSPSSIIWYRPKGGDALRLEGNQPVPISIGIGLVLHWQCLTESVVYSSVA